MFRIFYYRQYRISSEEIMIANLERMYLEYKRKKAIEEIEFKAKLKAFLNH